MNAYDAAIMEGHFPDEPPAGTVPAPPGHSYYWDCRATGLAHAAAVYRAACEMGSALGSVRAVER